MKPIIRWAVNNSPAMNTLMVALMIVGLVSLMSMRRETFPEFELELVLIEVPYPGASPAETEEGICQKLEEAVRPIAGIKKLTSIAQEGAGFVVVEMETGSDLQKIIAELRSEVDRIPSFPELSEDPEVKQITLRQTAIRVALIGPDKDSLEAGLALRDLAEGVRDDLVNLPSVSQANLMGALEYQIDVEIPEETLRKHGLSLQQVAQIIRRENVEIPGGTMRGSTQEVMLRGKNKRLTGEEIGKIPLVTQPNGVVLTVDDLGQVRDEFEDLAAISRVNGRPGIVVQVDRTASEDLLKIANEVRQYADSYRDEGFTPGENPLAAMGRMVGLSIDPPKTIKRQLPPGYELQIWQDTSIDVADRMHLLMRNGAQGLLLVFLVLAVFLEIRLAFWVALGIPIAILGASAYLLGTGQTLNMLSMFAFLMALGIVVDDAIVIGENIYAHRQRGVPVVQAAISGAYEVLPSVMASVCTTIIAFMPMLYVSGVMGKFIAVLPVAVIAMLALSLIESMTVLPCHLSHETNLFFRIVGIVLFPFGFLVDVFGWLNQQSDRILKIVVKRLYLPSLAWSIRYPAIVIAGAAGLLFFSLGFLRSGVTPWEIFPKLDSNWIEARINYPDGTPASVTDAATARIEQALQDIHDKYSDPVEGTQIVKLTYRAVGKIADTGTLGPEGRPDGSHIGMVFVEMHDTKSRPLKSDQIINEWREKSGSFPGAESVVFGTPDFGPGGKPIEFKLLAPVEHMADLEAAVELCKAELGNNDAVVDIRDDSSPGKWEYQLRIKDEALAMGVQAADLAETVRAAYYGDEVMRLQRGRHEVKLMVRYPRDARRSLANFDEIRIRGSDRAERPLSELAAIKVERGYSEINRVDQMRSITITADIIEGQGNASAIVRDLQEEFMPTIFQRYPEVKVLWEGQAEQSNESVRSLVSGFGVAMIAMYVLLTIEFRSYGQPILILLIIPFGFIGAIWGHALRGLPLSMFSLFGFVALTGVVVNDSIVLIDFINRQIKEGVALNQALINAGGRRFRPVLLTSVTTIAGLLPLLTETSFQAQVLIPMAVSLAFGLMVATFLVLYLVPTMYLVYGRLAGRGSGDDSETAEKISTANENASATENALAAAPGPPDAGS